MRRTIILIASAFILLFIGCDLNGDSGSSSNNYNSKDNSNTSNDNENIHMTEAIGTGIYTAEELVTFFKEDNALTGTYTLMADIDLSGLDNWPPIGTDYETPFSGTFYGNNYTIKNLTINAPDSNNQGVFGYIDEAKITNLILEDAFVIGNRDVGCLAGVADDSIISGCSSIKKDSSDNNVDINGWGRIGGLIGLSRYSTITNCYTTVNVNGESIIGGLIGYSYDKISNCYSSGTITGDSGFVGGLIGESNYATLSECYATGDVTGDDDRIGGLIGFCFYSKVLNCYASGELEGHTEVGGLLGRVCTKSLVSNSYALGDVTSDYSTGGLIGRCQESTVSECYSTGNIFCNSANGGGLIGSCWSAGTAVSDCYASAKVSGYGNNTGGLIGLCDPSNTISISNCYSIGAISGVTVFGGLIGCSSSESQTASYCYYNTETTGCDETNNNNGNPLSTEEMKVSTNYTDWDFTNIWTINSIMNNGYPYLKSNPPVKLD